MKGGRRRHSHARIHNIERSIEEQVRNQLRSEDAPIRARVLEIIIELQEGNSKHLQEFRDLMRFLPANQREYHERGIKKALEKFKAITEPTQKAI